MRARARDDSRTVLAFDAVQIMFKAIIKQE
jgi:hypothetical protein